MADDATVAQGSQSLPQGEDFRLFYDRTSRTAFSLAVRITGEQERAGAAVEAAYAAVWSGRVESTEPQEGVLLATVRERALALRPGSVAVLQSAAPGPAYNTAMALRDGLAGIDPLGRRTLELAYYGGIGAAQVAELLGEPVQVVRSALRRALLDLGALVSLEQESRT